MLCLVNHQTTYLARISNFPFSPDFRQFTQFNSELEGENVAQELENHVLEMVGGRDATFFYQL